jgi:hypothetical protein
MSLIDMAGAANVTIAATIDGGSGDWTPSGETYPIILGWGAELSAPGVYFFDPSLDGGHDAVFNVQIYSNKDSLGSASIIGTAANPIGVGMNAANTEHTNDVQAIEVNSTLYLANANVNGSEASFTSAIMVAATGTLVLGADQSNANSGTVFVGNALENFMTDGYVGIVSGGTVRDVAMSGTTSSVVVQGQNGFDFFLTDGSLTLSSNPVIGIAPTKAGFGACNIKHDGDGVVVFGGNVSLTNATVQCLGASGVGMAGGTATVSNSLIQNCDFGVAVVAGSLSLASSTIIYSVVGVQQQGGAAVDLSFGGNTVVCSSISEDPLEQYAAFGMDVYNSGQNVLNASNVAWDTAGPDTFTCNGDISNLTSCSCNLTTCATSPGSNDMDAVTIDGGTITTTGNTQSPLAVDAGCG